ncbi:MAG: hypothetical protein PHC41_00595 [Lachnospiraceae bacterium]|nr:hypothetical protein [Lachnospiraceae bacterium]MDD3614702.1 hypothetical protein [Lachnospiraceae bacterium]
MRYDLYEKLKEYAELYPAKIEELSERDFKDTYYYLNRQSVSTNTRTNQES